MKWETQGTETLRFTRGGSGTWRQYRVQAREGGRAEHMVTPRRAASATHRLRGIPNVRRGQGWGKR